MTKLPLSVLAIVCLLPACGAVCNDDTAKIEVSAPPQTVISVDGLEWGGHPSSVTVSNHHDHVISGKHLDGTTSYCKVSSEIKARYAIEDFILFASVVPLVVDALTEDWESIPDDQKTCLL